MIPHEGLCQHACLKSAGCWIYQSDSDRTTLIQAVSVQVRGQVLQKLGKGRKRERERMYSIMSTHPFPPPPISELYVSSQDCGWRLLS